jgi:hypothetical protein
LADVVKAHRYATKCGRATKIAKRQGAARGPREYHQRIATRRRSLLFVGMVGESHIRLRSSNVATDEYTHPFAWHSKGSRPTYTYLPDEQFNSCKTWDRLFQTGLWSFIGLLFMLKLINAKRR